MPELPAGSGATDHLDEGADTTQRVPPPEPDIPIILPEPVDLPPAPGVPPRIGPYEIRAELGRGGMGIVYRAFDGSLRREVALKVLLISGHVGFETLGRFYREARAAAKLAHPGIVQVYDVGVQDGRPYYTMEILPGKGLDDVLANPGLSPREAVDVVRQVALALQYAHERGVIHRDIKPRNIVASRASNGWTAKVVDFGLARIVERELRVGAGSRSATNLTHTGEVLGTPAYMSPEQTRGAHGIDGRSDVYSLGATLYETLTRTVPFDDTTLAGLFDAIARQDPLPLRRRNPLIDRDLETICVKCLQKDPRHRYETAGALAEDCRRWLEGEEIAARPIRTVVRAWRRAMRNRAVAVPFAGAALLFSAALGVWVGGAVSDELRLREHTESLEEHLSAGRPERALDEAKEAASIDPDDPRAKRLLARAHTELGRRLTAAYTRHARMSSTASEADHRRLVALRARAWSLAAMEFHEALHYDAENGDARQGLAALYWDELVAADAAGDVARVEECRAFVEQYGGAAARERLRGISRVK